LRLEQQQQQQQQQQQWQEQQRQRSVVKWSICCARGSRRPSSPGFRRQPAGDLTFVKKVNVKTLRKFGLIL
jgi:hypothetical protein